mmetsp:Transcript_16606/g.39855  ORF Transcript_16606/g.39855 Transcript_16606/m.39855 type:complete len:278 (-) Transcript_16606:328-1161(-)
MKSVFVVAYGFLCSLLVIVLILRGPYQGAFPPLLPRQTLVSPVDEELVHSIDDVGFYDKTYYKYQRPMGVFGGKAKQHLFEGLLRPTDTVMDFGCGGGFVLSHMNPRQARRICVEINPFGRSDAIKQGIEQVVAHVSSVRCGTVDLAFTLSVLEHVGCPICELRRIRATLKPRGRLLVGIKHEWKDEAFIGAKADADHHLYTWNRKLLGNMIEAAGFVDVRVEARMAAWPPNYVKVYEKLGAEGFDNASAEYGKKTGVRYIIAHAHNPQQANTTCMF